MARDEEGNYTASVEDLTHFLENARVQDAYGNTTIERWWHMHKDGTFTVDDEARHEPHNWPVPLMNFPGQAWVDQWEGDLQKALDTQIQPALNHIGQYFKDAEELASGGS